MVEMSDSDKEFLNYRFNDIKQDKNIIWKLVYSWL